MLMVPSDLFTYHSTIRFIHVYTKLTILSDFFTCTQSSHYCQIYSCVHKSHNTIRFIHVYTKLTNHPVYSDVLLFIRYERQYTTLQFFPVTEQLSTSKCTMLQFLPVTEQLCTSKCTTLQFLPVTERLCTSKCTTLQFLPVTDSFVRVSVQRYSFCP